MKGENNTVAHALSKLGIMSEPIEEAFFSKELGAELYYYGTEPFSAADYPLNYGMISQTQLKDKEITEAERKEEL